ncbi:MAG TPA: MerR family transcriptional regulator [Candidatus Binataceae bacterium]|nr:MerR family transcriptional regulator [Candidatus Binataceae bacterium]
MRSYSLAELVETSAFSVDTIRYYQSLGLLDGPEHRGRTAIYNESHLRRLRLIRSMSERGLPLKLVKTMLLRPKKDAVDRALWAAVKEKAREARYTSADFARLLGIPKGLLALVERSELREAIQDETGTNVFSDADLEAGRGVMRLLEYGVPLTALLDIALKHHRATSRTVDEAIDLFNNHVRGREGEGASVEAVADAFREMAPIVVSLVAQHFHRLLVGRALTRIKQTGDKRAFRVAQRTAGQVRFKVALR